MANLERTPEIAGPEHTIGLLDSLSEPWREDGHNSMNPIPRPASSRIRRLSGSQAKAAGAMVTKATAKTMARRTNMGASWATTLFSHPS
jgi:hypothetical protein